MVNYDLKPENCGKHSFLRLSGPADGRMLGYVQATATSIDAARPAIKIDSAFRAKLDRFGSLETRYREAKPWLDERDALKKTIQDLYAATPGTEPIRATGNLYYVDLSLREYQRKVTAPAKAFNALKKAMGVTALINGLTYTMKLLDAHTTEDQRKAFIVNERTGPRDISAVIIAAPKAA